MKTRGVSFVLFGGTGDLTRRKLAPAFSNLIKKSKLSDNSSLVGIARKKFSNEEYEKFLESPFEKGEKNSFKKIDVNYIDGDFYEDELFRRLAETLKKVEPLGGRDRIFYLATSFKFFPIIVEKLKKFSLHKQKRFFTRIVFEKPFGESLKSAIELDRSLHNIFGEKDIFRVDHYLGKGTVQNLNVLKFTNPIFYGSFSNKYVESIEVDVSEKDGAGNRIEYYDDAGAIKDIVQNHLLQILARLLMRKPERVNYEELHKEKIRILKSIVVKKSEKNLLGQYESYKSELGKIGKRSSETETFAKIVLECKSKEWRGVELILRTGKKLKEKSGQIRINYKEASGVKEKWIGATPNKILIDIYPKEDVTLIMNSRNPREINSTKDVKFNFCHECEFGPNTTSVYAEILEEIIGGNHSIFAKNDTLLECWKITEKILQMKNKMKFVKYRDGKDPD